MSTATNLAPSDGQTPGAGIRSDSIVRTALLASLVGTTIEWYDFFLYATAASLVFNHAFFLILNLAVGGDWPGSPNAQTVFPQSMLVDYVRVYQR